MKKQIQVKCIGYNLEHWHTIENIAYEFAEKLFLPLIVIQNSHGSPYSSERRVYKGKKMLRIYFWSAYFSTGRRTYDKSMFGRRPTDCGEHSRYPSEIPDIVHIKSPEGDVVAEYHNKYPNTLYILFDLPHQGQKEVEVHFRGILNAYTNTRFPDKKFVYTLKRQYEECARAARESQYGIEKLRSKRFGLQMEIIETQNELRFKSFLLKEKRARYKDEFLAIERAGSSLYMKGDALHIVSGDIEVVFNINLSFDSLPDYALFIEGEQVPTIDVCAGPAKSGLARYIGADKFFSAYTMIKRWAAVYKKKNTITKNEKEETA